MAGSCPAGKQAAELFHKLSNTGGCMRDHRQGGGLLIFALGGGEVGQCRATGHTRQQAAKRMAHGANIFIRDCAGNLIEFVEMPRPAGPVSTLQGSSNP